MQEVLSGMPQIILRTLIALLSLFLVSKIVGTRQISQMTFYDYIVGITLGDIAGTLALNVQVPWVHSLLSLIIFTLFTVSAAFLTSKSIAMRKFFTGSPRIVIDKGKILEKDLKRTTFDVNDLLSECRTNGYFNIEDIEYAVMETNGRISFLPKPEKRPLMAQDLTLQLPPEGLVANVVIDGHIMDKHLKAIGKNRAWLDKMLSARGYKVPDVLLAAADGQSSFTVYAKNNDSSADYFV